MYNLIKILTKYHVTLLFVVLELIALFMIFQYRNYQKSVFVNTANALTGNTYQAIQNFEDYKNLKEVNLALAQENATLRAMVPKTMKLINGGMVLQSDSIYQQQFSYKAAKVIQNSIYKKDNFLTINLGSNDGIQAEMGVITDKGVVGFVTFVSENYATVLSFLNSKSSVSVKIKRNKAAGTLIWDGKNHLNATILDIPLTTNVFVGDTIISSGYSAFYPAGIPMGTVTKINLGQNKQMHQIKVKLAQDFNKLNYVYVVENLVKNELDSLNNKMDSMLTD